MKAELVWSLILWFPSLAVADDSGAKVPWFELPSSASTIDGIVFGGIFVKNPDESVEPLRPDIEEYSFDGHSYIAAIDNGILGPSNIHTVRVWVYLFDREDKEWRCIHFTRFERLYTVRSELDAGTGQLKFVSAANNEYRDTIVSLVNLSRVPKYDREENEEEEDEEGTQPGATDNPDDAQRLREDH